MVAVVPPERPADELADLIDALHRALCSSHHDLLAAVGEHDRIEAWRGAGARSEEDYLTRELGVAYRTARDWVRAARVLTTEPALRANFACGTVSWDKVNSASEMIAARTPSAAQPLGPFDDPAGGGAGDPDASAPDPRGASPDGAPDTGAGDNATGADAPCGTGSAGGDVAGLAETLTAAQLARLAAQARQAAAEEANRLHRRRHCKVVRAEADRRLSITGAELFDDDAATVWAAISDYTHNTKPDPITGLYDPFPMRAADALVAMATAYLAAREKVTNHPLVVFHADARVVAGEQGWAETSDYAPVAAETIRRLACSCHLTLSADDHAGNALRLGRKVREATWQQVEVCKRRDGGCRLCESRLFTHAHHIREWDRDHGPTDDTNLVTLCSRCHHLVHEGGWTITGDPYAELVFTSPTGRTVRRAPHPAHPPGRRRPDTPPGDPPDQRPERPPARSGFGPCPTSGDSPRRRARPGARAGLRTATPAARPAESTGTGRRSRR